MIAGCPEEATNLPPSPVTPEINLLVNGDVEITWTDPTDADFSHILITWEPVDPNVPQPLRVEKGTETATITGLDDGTEYTFTVISVDTDGNEAKPETPPAPVTVDGSAPPPVTLTASAQAGASVEITWTEPTDTDYSHILLSWAPEGGAPAQPLRVDRGTATATITGLSDSMEYMFTAISVDALGNESAPSAAAAVTADATPPGLVTSLTSTLTPNGGVIFTWDDPSDSDFSHVRITWEPERNPLLVNTGIETATATGLPHGVNHEVRIQSFDVAGNRSLNAVSPPFVPDAVAPLAVTNINTTVTSASISLTWTDPTANDLSHINVTWSPADGGQQPLRIDSGVQAAALTGLDSATQYTVTISSSDTVGNETAATATPTTAVFNATAVTAASATTITADGTTTISWTDPTATSSIAKISITGTPAPTTAVEAALGSGTASITGLTAPGSRHTFTINTLDSSDAVLGTTTVTAAAATIRPVALFRLLGGTDNLYNGAFGITSCNTFLTTNTGETAVAMRNAGYTEAILFGSRRNVYNFPDIATDSDALGIDNVPNATLNARAVVVYTGASPTTFGTRTINDVLDVGTSGGWQHGGYSVVDDLATGNFWSFTNNREGSAASCFGASNTQVTGGVGNANSISDTTLSCSSRLAVLCAAH